MGETQPNFTNRDSLNFFKWVVWVVFHSRCITTSKFWSAHCQTEEADRSTRMAAKQCAVLTLHCIMPYQLCGSDSFDANYSQERI